MVIMHICIAYAKNLAILIDPPKPPGQKTQHSDLDSPWAFSRAGSIWI